MGLVIVEPCDCCEPEKRKRCMVMPRGMDLDRLNARIEAAYPKTLAILAQALCEKCDHRADHRGCKFGRMPLTECGAYGCKYFRQWGDWRPQGQKKASVMNKS